MDGDINLMNAIVIADDHYNGLGVIRSLGEKNINIYLILLTEGRSFIDKSKYVTKLYKIKKDKMVILDTIRLIINPNENYAVLPLSDFSALFCDEYYDKMPQNVVMPNAKGKLNILENKYIMANIAQDVGLTIPKHIEIKLKEVISFEWGIYPAIIKPILSVEGLKSDISIVNNYSELMETLKDFSIKGYERVLLEEYITGNEEYMIEVLGYVNSSGESVFSNIICKIREFPIKNGSTAYAYFIDSHNGIDEKKLNLFIKKCGYFGLFDFEFKYADGKVYFIEVNFRNGAPSYASTLSGLNIPYCWILNKEKSSKLRKKFTFMCEQNDVINMLKGEVGFANWLKQFISSKKIFWNWKDFKPILIYYYYFLLQILRRKKK